MLQNAIFIEKKMNLELLTKAPLFMSLDTEEISRLLTTIPYRTRRFKPGSMIAICGEQVNALNLVIEGVVKGEMVDFEGRVIKIEDIPAPGALAAGFIFGKKNFFPVNVIAITDAELLIIDKKEFLALLRSNDVVLLNFLNMISNRSQFLSEKIRFLTFKTIKGKLAHYLLQMVRKDNTTVVMDKTQNELAEFFGVARPSIGRTLGEMQAEGIIEVDRKNVRILDIESLADLTAD